MIINSGNAPRAPHEYGLVTEDGALTFHTTTFQELKQRLIPDNPGYGGTTIEDIPHCFPIFAFHYTTYDPTKRGRRNIVANGMFWELSAPSDAHVDGYASELVTTEQRLVKMRGPVAFTRRADGLSVEQREAICTAHRRAVARLKDMGWL